MRGETGAISAHVVSCTLYCYTPVYRYSRPHSSCGVCVYVGLNTSTAASVARCLSEVLSACSPCRASARSPPSSSGTSYRRHPRRSLLKEKNTSIATANPNTNITNDNYISNYLTSAATTATLTKTFSTHLSNKHISNHASNHTNNHINSYNSDLIKMDHSDPIPHRRGKRRHRY